MVESLQGCTTRCMQITTCASRADKITLQNRVTRPFEAFRIEIKMHLKNPFQRYTNLFVRDELVIECYTMDVGSEVYSYPVFDPGFS